MTPVRINFAKAIVPLVPLGLLFASGLPEPYRLFDIPDEWVILPKDGKRDLTYNSRLIGLAMLAGVVVAIMVTPSKARDCAKQFFDGAGYGFANIVSLIVTANCFGVAIREVGLSNELGKLIALYPELLQPLAGVVPLSFAAVSGSGMASTQSLFRDSFMVPPSLSAQTRPGSVLSCLSARPPGGRSPPLPQSCSCAPP